MSRNDMQKQCRTCKRRKDSREFNKHTRYKDGLRGQCRDCQREEYYQNQEVVLARSKKYFQTPEGKAAQSRASKLSMQRHPEKHKALHALGHAVAVGKIIRPKVCSVCGQERGVINGHHPDYNKPYDVVWLCSRCHGKEHREGKRETICV